MSVLPSEKQGRPRNASVEAIVCVGMLKERQEAYITIVLKRFDAHPARFTCKTNSMDFFTTTSNGTYIGFEVSLKSSVSLIRVLLYL